MKINKNVFVTGGAGYIGSHACKALLNAVLICVGSSKKEVWEAACVLSGGLLRRINSYCKTSSDSVLDESCSSFKADLANVIMKKKKEVISRTCFADSIFSKYGV